MTTPVSEPLRPRFFVTRQNGSMVPLIAMDELPSTIIIRDVARTLSPYDVAGMTGVGTFDTRHRHHIVEGPASSFSQKREPECRDNSLMASSFARGDLEPATSPGIIAMPVTSSFPAAPKAYGIQEQAPGSLHSPFLASQPLRVDRNAKGPAALPVWHDPAALPVCSAPGVKEYCSYWLRHGECDYAQQGCLYRHEMPLDRPTLESLGLRDIPRWYREKHGLGSYLAGGSTVIGSSANQEADKKGAMEKNWRGHHPAEALLDGTEKKHGRDPGREKTTSLEGRQALANGVGSSRLTQVPRSAYRQKPEQRSSSEIRFPINLAPAQTTPRATTKPTNPSPPPAVPTIEEQNETLRARHMREMIADLDAYNQLQQEKDLLAEKYKILQPERSNLAVNPAAVIEDDMMSRSAAVSSMEDTDGLEEGEIIDYTATTEEEEEAIDSVNRCHLKHTITPGSSSGEAENSGGRRVKGPMSFGDRSAYRVVDGVAHLVEHGGHGSGAGAGAVAGAGGRASAKKTMLRVRRAKGTGLGITREGEVVAPMGIQGE